MNTRKHWIIRVKDGENFRNSTYPIWGIKSGRNNSVKTIISKMNSGDILWFMTSKEFGGKLIGMSEYIGFEQITDVNEVQRMSRLQNWQEYANWDLCIYYQNAYNTERQDIQACIQCAANIMEYETFRNRIQDDLYVHYDNFIRYAERKRFFLNQ